MNKNIKDIKKNPPYRSQLNPVKNIIFNAWFQERKSAKVIQLMLSESHNINVSLTCIYKFIRVRRKKPDPHDMPSFMQNQEQQTKSPIQEEKPKEAVPASDGIKNSSQPRQRLTKEQLEHLERMQKQTKYEAYQEAVRLKMAKKKTQKP